MTPEQISIINTIALILDKIGTWPPMTLVAVVVIGPWVGLYLFSRSDDNRMQKVFERQDKRFEEVVQMYENNVELVKSYENVTKSYSEITDNMQELVILTTQTLQKLVDRIDSNLFCPIVRKETSQKEINR